MRYLFLKYNNYYNRRIKRCTSTIEYEKTSTNYYVDLVNQYNFNEKDNLATEITFNWTESWLPDYFVAWYTAVNKEYIVSRWFIVKSEKVRNQQYKFTLKRDLIADDYSNLGNNIYNVNRCMLDANNPLLFNKEGFTFNQIKKDEQPLYDETLCPWIIGYMPKGQSLSKITVSSSTDYDIDARDIDHTDWEYYKYVNNPLEASPQLEGFKVPIQTIDSQYVITYNTYLAYSSPSSDWNVDVDPRPNYISIDCDYEHYTASREASRHNWVDWNTLNKLLASVNPTYDHSDIVDTLLNYAGNKVLFKDGVYLVNFYSTNNVYVKQNYGENSKNGSDDDLTRYIANTFANKTNGEVKYYNQVGVYYSYKVYKLVLTKVSEAQTISFEIPATSNNLSDAPYKMFCMPYPVDSSIKLNGYEMSKETSELVYNNIIANTTTTGSNDTLYDIQILPYCPLKFKSTSYSDGINSLTFNDGWSDNIDYSVIMEDNNPVGYILYPKESSFNFYVSKALKNSTLKDLSSALVMDSDKKISNETEFIRLVSPNYSGQYEMSLAKNNGLIALQVLATYKPYNPFIEVQPVYSGLYGSNYNDARGLICTGDFSLPIINSAWKQYELNNKTYQQAFNREVQHMEVYNDINNTNAIASAIAGGVSATVQGAMTGSLVGGGLGALAGGTISGLASTAGGIADYKILQKQQKEDLSYKKDMFNFSLQNIKALPNSLSKTSSLNANSKYVPFIEYYSATDKEKELLKEYIKLNGMKAGYVGTFNVSGYVEANILKYNGDLTPSELAELNNELMKGVYIE